MSGERQPVIAHQDQHYRDHQCHGEFAQPGQFGFTNTTNGNGNTTRTVALTVYSSPTLAISPGSGLTASGVVVDFSGSFINKVPVNGTDVRITWQAGGGQTNVVQASINLSTNYFNISPNIILPPAGDVMTNFVEYGGVTNSTPRFYRIQVVP